MSGGSTRGAAQRTGDAAMSDLPEYLAPDARAVLLAHRPNSYGLCAGCWREWTRIVRYPCTYAAWALTVDREGRPERRPYPGQKTTNRWL